jgi:hypothetical protein
MGDQKAQRLPQAGANSKSGKGAGAESHSPHDDRQAGGLAARDADTGQLRTGKNTEGTGL